MKKCLEEKNIYASYDDKTVRVYQAYSEEIANEAFRLQTFGNSFKLTRMTWIKPSFLWMMYRSGWATKEGQKRILAIDITRNGFDEILSNAILSSFEESTYSNYDDWKDQLIKSDVRCQFDPERDIYGSPIGRRAIQLGLKGEIVLKYVNAWIVTISDITVQVNNWKKMIDEGEFNFSLLPHETVYPINENIAIRLGIGLR